ncbi:hypothetical protein HRI_000717400 [Hibiscus trionum]|uniref:Transcription elongation factor 1 homolog n=1 Tax=Hibiscus trionum TaxID=183268 RepID=A0A9W7H5M0_HIBTR|nr:hypothetical protein HRI_000717400 [Hibiscus trionum]
MGKRKSRAKPAPKKRMDKLDTVFSCPFCNHGTYVECRTYSEWIDECERVNNHEEEEEYEEEEEEEEDVDVDQDDGYVPKKRVSIAE